MAEKYGCVIDAAGRYVTFVIVLDNQVQHYTLKDGESLIDAKPPTHKQYAGADGFVVPAWDADASAWTEGATAAELADWVSEHTLPAEELAAEARSKRDKLLAATDWTQVLDAPIDAETRDAYRAYRQALRDIPEQEGFPGTITWPELPAVAKAAPDPIDTAVDTLLGGETA